MYEERVIKHEHCLQGTAVGSDSGLKQRTAELSRNCVASLMLQNDLSYETGSCGLY